MDHLSLLTIHPIASLDRFEFLSMITSLPNFSIQLDPISDHIIPILRDCNMRQVFYTMEFVGDLLFDLVYPEINSYFISIRISQSKIVFLVIILILRYLKRW